jgi:hypothetical protein
MTLKIEGNFEENNVTNWVHLVEYHLVEWTLGRKGHLVEWTLGRKGHLIEWTLGRKGHLVEIHIFLFISVWGHFVENYNY